MLIGGDDISNDVITLGLCFSMFVYFSACFHFALIGENQRASRLEAAGELEVEVKFQRCSCKLYFLFPPCHQSDLESLLTGYEVAGPCSLWHIPKPMII